MKLEPWSLREIHQLLKKVMKETKTIERDNKDTPKLWVVAMLELVDGSESVIVYNDQSMILRAL